MDLQNITLVSFGYFEEDLIKNVADSVNHEFHFKVNIKEGHLDLSEYYDPGRRQYNGTKLLKEVDYLFSTDQSKTLGLFSVDLFIPILTYIFGQAFLNGRTGIASLYRLSNERYGINADNKYVPDRFGKEVIHELGHTFGLVHCYVPTCVMRSSTYVEDIDQKSANLCLKCREAISSLLI
jgi:archaemetzincin